MKKLMFCIALTLGLILQGSYANAQTLDPSVIKSDPDWQTIARIEGGFIDKFVSAKIDLANFDLNNEKLVLSVIGMTKDEYLKNVDLVRAAANSLAKKYAIDPANCPSCKMDNDSKNSTFKTVVAQFRANPDIYTRFRGESLGLDAGTNKTQSCCGFGFYACCTVCAFSIEVFPVYLACCALCHHSQCCSN